MLALALVLVLEGVDRRTAAETCGLDRQTLRDWGEGRPEFYPVGRIQPGTGGAPFFPTKARIGQQGTLTRIWAERGTRPRAPRDIRHKWAARRRQRA